jgi:hypothetical protein
MLFAFSPKLFSKKSNKTIKIFCMNKEYKLPIDGDQVEIKYWPLFIKEYFSNYEKFWCHFVVPLTNRPINQYFKTNKELKKINKGDKEICIAQLNYTMLNHFIRSWDIINCLNCCNDIKKQQNYLIEGITRLVGATDNLFELIERFNNPLDYKSFEDGETARKNYKEKNDYPMQLLRDYRNSILHGKMLASILVNEELYALKIGNDKKYTDWRFENKIKIDFFKYKEDFDSIKNILKKAWEETIEYANKEIGKLKVEELEKCISELFSKIKEKDNYLGIDSDIMSQIYLEGEALSGIISVDENKK